MMKNDEASDELGDAYFQAPTKEEQAITDEQYPWNSFQEGELVIDMYKTETTVIVRSLLAGVDPKDIEISLHQDVLTIRGKREETEMIYEDQFFHRECFWGSFSRSVVLPVSVDEKNIKAFFKHGLVIIELPRKQEEIFVTQDYNSISTQ